MKELRCRDIGFDCDGVVQGDSEKAVLQAAATHARDVHHVAEFTPAQLSQMRAQIQEVPEEQSSNHSA